MHPQIKFLSEALHEQLSTSATVITMVNRWAWSFGHHHRRRKQFVGGGTKFAWIFFHLPEYDQFSWQISRLLKLGHWASRLVVPEVKTVSPKTKYKKAFSRNFDQNYILSVQIISVFQP